MMIATIYEHGSFVFFIYVCVSSLLGLFGLSDLSVPEFWKSFFIVAFEVAVGAGVTVLFIDRFNAHRAQENLKRRLIREAGSRSHDVAISAVEWMDREGWLTGEDGLLQGANLRNARLSSAPLKYANLQDTKMQNADLSGAELENAILKCVNLTGANFEKARLIGAKMQGANLIGTDLKSANLNEANLQKATMIRVDVEGAFFYQAADFTGATLLEMVNLRGANFSVCLEDFLLSGDSYDEAVRHNASFERAQLRGAELNGVNLRMVNMKGAILRKADLRGAKLAGAIFRDADLSGTLLEGAFIHDVKDVSAEGAKWIEAPDDGNESSRFFPKTDFSGATLPDGKTIFTDDMDFDVIRQFTDPSHPNFPAKLLDVKAIPADLHDIYDIQ